MFEIFYRFVCFRWVVFGIGSIFLGTFSEVTGQFFESIAPHDGALLWRADVPLWGGKIGSWGRIVSSPISVVRWGGEREWNGNRQQVAVIELDQVIKDIDALDALMIRAGGVIIRIRRRTEAYETRHIESHLIRNTTKAAVYFVEDSPEWESIVESFRIGKKLLLRPISLDPIPIAHAAGYQLEASVNPLSQSEEIILIVASHDSFAAAPLWSECIAIMGSGIVATAQVAKTVAIAIRQRGKPKYNVVFLFCDRSSDNYAGIEEWISRRVDLLPKIKFVLGVDSLAHFLIPGNELYLHLSAPPGRETSDLPVERLSVAFEQMGIKLHTKRTPLLLYDMDCRMPHERFARRGVPSGTISVSPEYVRLDQRVSMYDNRVTPALIKSVTTGSGAMSAFLLEWIFDEKEKMEPIEESSVGNWLRKLNHGRAWPRSSGLPSNFYEQQEAHMRLWGFSVKSIKYYMSDPDVHYTGGGATLLVVEQRPVAYDMMILLITCAVLWLTLASRERLFLTLTESPERRKA